MLGKAKRFELRENALATHRYLKGPTMTLDQRGGYAVFFFNRILQTCSIGEVVSFNAIFDGNIHQINSFTRVTGS
jgi:hypothetical protein